VGVPRPVLAGSVVAWRPPGIAYGGTSGIAHDGSFGLDVFPPFPLLVSARVGSRVCWPPVAADPTQERHGEFVLPLVEGGAIEVEVRESAETARRGVRVEADGGPGPLPEDAVTDDAGRVRLVGLCPGRWRVRTSPRGWPAVVESEVEVTLGASTKVVLTRPAAEAK
jgi:hypothetical protein